MTLKEKLKLCSTKRLIVSYKPMVRVSAVCKAALKEIERLEGELRKGSGEGTCR